MIRISYLSNVRELKDPVERMVLMAVLEHLVHLVQMVNLEPLDLKEIPAHPEKLENPDIKEKLVLQ